MEVIILSTKRIKSEHIRLWQKAQHKMNKLKSADLPSKYISIANVFYTFKLHHIQIIINQLFHYIWKLFTNSAQTLLEMQLLNKSNRIILKSKGSEVQRSRRSPALWAVGPGASYSTFFSHQFSHHWNNDTDI